jgi:hypothetical protein
VDVNQPQERPLPPRARRPDLRLGAVIAVAVAIAFVVWLLVRGGDSNGTKSADATPVAASVEQLRELSVELGHPVYWAGPLPNRTYELTRTDADRVFIRYLPEGVPVGIREAAFTIIGTYPVPNAYKVLKNIAKKAGETSFTAPLGGFAVYSTSQPTNIYLAYPGSSLQIEVFDPAPRRARSLITSGQVSPVR